jgi:PAS domain S-box-containing protein
MSTQPDLTAMPWSVMGLAVAVLALAVLLAWTVRALRQARAAGHRAGRLLQLLADEAGEHALVELDASGHVMQWSAGAQRLHGYATQEIVGKHCSRLYTDEDRGANVPQQDLELAARNGRHTVNSWRTGKGAQRVVTQTSIHAQRDHAGHLIGFIGVEHDLSDRTQLQQALEHTRAALAQTRNLAALGRLADGIAHDFNNIIQVISAGAETLQRRLTGQAQAQAAEFLQMTRRNAERAAGLSQHLRSLARRQPSAAVLTNVNEVVAGVVELLRHTLSEEITLDVRVGGGLLWTVIDPNQLEAALLSLAVSAREAMPGKGVLSIETAEAVESPVPPGGNAAGDAARAGHYILIAVSHTGASADSSAGAQWEEFGPQEVRGFIEQAGGILESDPNGTHGMTVTLYLPRGSG